MNNNENQEVEICKCGQQFTKNILSQTELCSDCQLEQLKNL